MEEQLDNMATISPEAIVEIAEQKGKDFGNRKIKTHQIRNFYGEVTAMKLLAKRSKAETGRLDSQALLRKLILLKPKLAYSSGKKDEVKDVYNFMVRVIKGIQIVEEEKKEIAFENFFDLIESVVSYHKFYGDK